MIRRALDRIYAPEWAGGWALTRISFAAIALLTHGPRLAGIGDVYGAPDMSFVSGPFRLAERWILTEASATAVWALGVIAALGLGWGGRLAKPALLVFLGAYWLLLADEALNIKAYDRLLTWIALALLFAPIGERGLTEKRRSPFARYLMIVAFAGIYGSTGWLKLLEEPAWFSGEVLGNHLVHWYFGMKPLGVWLSDRDWALIPMEFVTVAAEASFPFLIWIRRLNPLVLLVMCLMHVGILLTMNVGPFSFVALAAYPALLHPTYAERIYARLRR